jgi:hypothetical protein
MSSFQGLKCHILATGYQNTWILFAHILHTMRELEKSEASGAIY